MKINMLISTHHLIRIILLCFIFSLIINAQNPELPGSLSINLKEEGNIYLDSELIANESFQNLNLNPGKYLLSAHNSHSRKWSQRGYEKEITIHPGENLNLSIKFSEDIYINSLPYDAKIIYNEKIIGSTPAFIKMDLTKDEKIISLEKDGYQNSSVLILPEKLNYFARLTPKSDNSQSRPVLVKLNNSQTTWYKEGLVAVSLLSSWGAFYFKREADKNFDKYMDQDDVKSMNKYFDKTKRFDTLSEVCIGISAAAIGTYMYFLIFD